jgi:hypothetical protein
MCRRGAVRVVNLIVRITPWDPGGMRINSVEQGVERAAGVTPDGSLPLFGHYPPPAVDHPNQWSAGASSTAGAVSSVRRSSMVHLGARAQLAQQRFLQHVHGFGQQGLVRSIDVGQLESTPGAEPARAGAGGRAAQRQTRLGSASPGWPVAPMVDRFTACATGVSEAGRARSGPPIRPDQAPGLPARRSPPRPRSGRTSSRRTGSR